MSSFVHIFCLTVFTLVFKYLFLRDLYFYFDDFSVFTHFDEKNSIFPVFTDRPLAGFFLILVFQVFRWNAIYYHIFGAVLEIIANLTVYYITDRLIWHNKFYSTLTVLFFLLIPGHSQQYWWITLLSLKLLLVMWLASLYFFNQFLLTNKLKYLFWSSLLYGTTLFWYELALFLPLIHSLLYLRYFISKSDKNFKLVTSIYFFVIYMGFFLIFRITKSFGLNASFDRSKIIGTENFFARIKNVLEATFFSYPNMDYHYGLEAFKNSDFTILYWMATCSLFVFLLVIWFQPIIKSSDNILPFTKNNYIFTVILGLCLSLYPLIPFFISSAWFDTRHTYLPHLGLAVLIVLTIRGLLEIIQRLKYKKLKYMIILLILYFTSQIFTLGMESMIGLGIIWRQVGLDIKNYEFIVKQEFPTVKPQTLFLIKDSETSRSGVPVFAGNWVVDGFFKKIYPHQKVRGNFYNILTVDNQNNLTVEINPELEINPKLSNIKLWDNQYTFEQVIILDGKNELRPFSVINIKTPEGDYLRRLQTSDNSATIAPVLELAIP
jgi:hypothetical protein